MSNDTLRYLCGIRDMIAKNWPRRTKSAAHFILDHSFTFEGPVKVLPGGVAKDCYRNAALLAIGSRAMIYREGFAIPNGFGFPVEHAWCLNGQGNIFEVTWEKAGRDYVGIRFKTSWLRRYLMRSKMSGVLDFAGLRELDKTPPVWKASEDIA